jgi:hypothetical protein
VAKVKQDEVLHLNNGQTGESGSVPPQTNWNIFLKTTIVIGHWSLGIGGKMVGNVLHAWLARLWTLQQILK